MTVRIGNRRIGPSDPPYIIAEIGVNHDGSGQRAIELVDAAHRAGADAIKLQVFEASRLLSSAARLASYQARSGMPDPVTMLQRLVLSVEQMKPIVKHAHRHGLHSIA